MRVFWMQNSGVKTLKNTRMPKRRVKFVAKTMQFPVPYAKPKRHALYKHVCAQLFSNRFLVTKTHSQDFRHAYAYNSTATEHCTGCRCSLQSCAYAHYVSAWRFALQEVGKPRYRDFPIRCAIEITHVFKTPGLLPWKKHTCVSGIGQQTGTEVLRFLDRLVYCTWHV